MIQQFLKHQIDFGLTMNGFHQNEELLVYLLEEHHRYFFMGLSLYLASFAAYLLFRC